MQKSAQHKGQILGPYRIRELLGTGGMGEVYLAEDTRLGRKVAIKFLNEHAESEINLQRFFQEARAASGLNHPNILTIYEIGQTENTHFIASEYIEGETLRDQLKRNQLSLRETLDIAVQIASALAAAHASNIIHRDIKPENVMIRKDGLAKVLDFGLAKLTARPPVGSEDETARQIRTLPGIIMGTVAYMSPEQARGKETDARTDVFSFGVLLYEMASGRRPFFGDTTSDLLASILMSEPRPPTDFNPQIPAELEGAILKMLRKNREERHQRASDLLTELKELQQELEFNAKLKGSVGTRKKEEAALKSIVAEKRDGGITSRPQFLASLTKPHRNIVATVLAIVLLAAIVTAYWLYSKRTAPANANQIESIVVLPFQNLTNDADAEYLSDGISEALINSLTDVQRLRVIARTTAFRYKGMQIDPQTVGRELNVRAVLMGRVLQTGDTLNVKVDLVDATTGAQLWGDEYERKVTDVLTVKQTIAREVTEQLRLKLSGDEQRQLVKRDSTNVQAYQHFLRGRHFWNKRNAEALKRAITEFQQAIDLDPAYALGYVGLADCYLVSETVIGAAAEDLPKARAAADRALQIDNSLPEAHASSAMVYEQMWRWAEAEQEFKRAINLNPNYPTVHHWFSHYYRAKRQFDDALREIKRAQELDPLSPPINHNLAQIYLVKGDHKAAIEQSEKVNELEPNFSRNVMAFAYLKQGDYENALLHFQKDVEVFHRDSQDLASLGHAYALIGKRDEALRIVKEIEGKYAKGEALGQYVAAVYAGLRDNDRAFAWLEKDFQRRSGTLTFITWLLEFEPLRPDPRYAELVRRMGLEA